MKLYLRTDLELNKACAFDEHKTPQQTRLSLRRRTTTDHCSLMHTST